MPHRRRLHEHAHPVGLCRVGTTGNGAAMRGFALLLVLWTLVVLSTVALTLAATVGMEVRASQDSWSELQAERLAKSGHDLADYLQTRGLGTTGENLTGLPAEQIIPHFSYRVRLDI